jgi:glycerol-3-phosphate acyltransferase PlsY
MGSIPTAYIAGIIINGRDIRRMGDGNMGAQNAFRQLGPSTGILVGIIDAVKGVLVIIIAYVVGISQPAILLVGIAAVIGHNWPIFLGFHGGRGECTTIGIFSVLVTLPMLIAGILAIFVLLMTRNVIKTSIVLFTALPLLCWWFAFPSLVIAYCIFLPSLVGFTHYIRTKKRAVYPA